MTDDAPPDQPVAQDTTPEPPDAEPTPTGPASDQPRRSMATRVLLVVATVFALIGTLTTWVNIQLLDTDEWVDLSRELLADEEIQQALSERVIDVIYTNVPVGEAIDDALPDAISGIGGVLAGAVRDPLTNSVERALSSDRVQDAWAEANRLVHQEFVAIMRNETGDFVSTDGDLTIELRPLIIDVGQSLGLPDGLLDRIPEDVGSFVVLDADVLDAMQTTVRLADLSRWVPVIFAVVLYAVAVFVAGTGSRTWAMRGVGWGLVIVAAVVLLIRRLSATLVVPILVKRPENEGVGVATIDISTRLLSEIGRTVLWFGVLIVLVTTLLGVGRRATAVRRFVAPALTAPAVAVAAGTVLFVLLMLWWSPARLFETWFSALWFLILTVLAVVVLRRTALREAPDQTWSDSAGQLRRT